MLLLHAVVKIKRRNIDSRWDRSWGISINKQWNNITTETILSVCRRSCDDFIRKLRKVETCIMTNSLIWLFSIREVSVGKHIGFSVLQVYYFSETRNLFLFTRLKSNIEVQYITTSIQNYLWIIKTVKR